MIIQLMEVIVWIFSDCAELFGIETINGISRDDSVVCETQFSKVVPLEDGEIVVSLLNNRPSANNFFNSTVLQEWTKATNIRFRMLRPKTLLGTWTSYSRNDFTLTRRVSELFCHILSFPRLRLWYLMKTSE